MSKSKPGSIYDSILSSYRGHRYRVRLGPVDRQTVNFSPCCHYSETVSVPAYDVNLGRFVRVKQRKLHNPISDMSQYKVSDFYLENQIESGSINELSRVTMINNDLSASEAHVLDSLSRLESSIESTSTATSIANPNI